MRIVDLSPPLAHRDRDNKPSLIVLHATAGGTARSSIDHLRGVGLSYHYIIARDGKDSGKFETSDGSDAIVFRCVPNEKHAFHTGSTIPTPDGFGINKASIGISLANIQRVTIPEPYPPKQLAALNDLIAQLLAEVPNLKRLTVHAVVQPWNRSDPRGVDGKPIAQRHGLEFWVPTVDQIKKHTPPKK